MSDYEADARFMAAAIALGRRGLGLCAPNPAVGALLVKDNVILARGWTKPGGRPHAETEALQAAGAMARGATLYATLEPCSHHGMTPPCTDAIIAAGVARVVYALDDPDPRVAGGGDRILTSAGLEVTKGPLAAAALRANLGHILRICARRPMITLKLAVTADGYAAGAGGEPRLAITGPQANGLVHIMRAMHDAIMVGSGTILADDPMLNVRLPGLESRRPPRVALDPDLETPPKSRFAASADAYPTLIVAGPEAAEENAARLREKGIEVARSPIDAAGRLDLAAALSLLAARGLTRVFCEGGPSLAASLIGLDVADEMIILTSAKSLGRPGLAGLSPAAAAALADPKRYAKAETRAVGDDVLTRYERVLQKCLPAL
jgi:diaminohydroxyphosphoribosylaminopyrimidine deaminase/5-amino-6-(5-phosphoribosylamino)uracil reductase